MNANFNTEIRRYLTNHNNRNRFLWCIFGLSICVALCVYSALTLPALGIQGDKFQITSNFPKNIYGETISAKIQASSEEDEEKTVFLVKSITKESHLSDDIVFTDSIAQITLNDNKILELHKIVPEESAEDIQDDSHKDTYDMYWFELMDNESAEFDLNYISDKITESEAQGEDATVSLAYSYGSSLDEALTFFTDPFPTQVLVTPLILTWTNSSNVRDYLRQTQVFSNQTLSPRIYTDSTLQGFVEDGSVSMTVNGLMPENATITVFPVENVTVNGVKIIEAYDITVRYANGFIFEPAEGNNFSVVISSPKIKQPSSRESYAVYHISKDLNEPSVVESSVSVATNTVEFKAPSFSVYALGVGEMGDEEIAALEASNENTSLDINKSIDYLGDGVANGHTILSGDDFYRLYLDLNTNLSAETPVDLALIIDRSSSMNEQDMIRSDGTLITRSQAIVDLLNTSANNPSFIESFLARNNQNKISIGWFSGDDTASSSITKGIAQTWTSSDFTVTNGSGTTANNRNIGGLSDAGTNYMAGLWQALELLNDSAVATSGHKKMVIFLSDGVPTYAFFNGSYSLGNYYYKTTGSAATYQQNHSNLGSLSVVGEGTFAIDPLQLVNKLTKDAITDFKANLPSGTIVYSVNYGDPPCYLYTSNITEAEGYDATNPDVTSQAKYRGTSVWMNSSSRFALSDTCPSGYVAAYVKQTFRDYTPDKPLNSSEQIQVSISGTAYKVWVNTVTHAIVYSNSTPTGCTAAYKKIPLYTPDKPTPLAQQAIYSSPAQPVWISSNTGEIFVGNSNPYSNTTGVHTVPAYQQDWNFVLKSMTSGGGILVAADDRTSLESSFASMLGVSITGAEIEDTLSSYVNWYGTLPDLKITRKNFLTGVSTVLWSSTGSYSSGIIGSATLDNTFEGQSIINSVTYNDSTKKLLVVFNPDFVFSPECIYEISYNIEVSDAAYSTYVTSGYTDTGDINTDYIEGDNHNSTSSSNLGFHSNVNAFLTYYVDGTQSTSSYNHPVVQVHSGNINILKVNRSNVVIGNVEFSLYKSNSEWTRGELCSSGTTSSFTTGGSNISFNNLRTGNYLLYETQTTDNYVLPANPWRVSISRNATTNETSVVMSQYDGQLDSWNAMTPIIGGVYSIQNYGEFILPSTGGYGGIWYMVFGLMILLVGGVYWIIKVKRGILEE